MFATILRRISIGLGLACLPAAIASAQTSLDRADPALVEEEEVRRDGEPRSQPSAPALLERPAASVTGTREPMLIGAIRVEGARELDPAAFAPVVERYAGRLLSPPELRSLASDVANVARAAGFGLASAWIPPQRVTAGVLRVVLDEGLIDGIEAEGSAAGVVRRMLAPLIGERAVRTAELERRLLLAGDVAGVRVGKARLDRRGGRNILRISTRREHVLGYANLDSWGSSAVGPIRARMTVNVNGLLADDDRLTVGGVVTPIAPKEFMLARLGYAKLIGTNGTEAKIGAYVARSRPGGALSGRDIEGRSAEAHVALAHPFLRSRAASLWGELEFTVRDAEQDRRGTRIREDRLATLAASTTVTGRLGRGRGQGRLGFVQGLDVLDATEAGDPLASRSDGSGIFSKLEFWAEYDRPLGSRFSLQLQAEGQIASRPLLSSEEMGLGGRTFLRGYDYREYSGDKGIVGSAELRFDLKPLPQPIEAVQLYVYADAGSVGNYDGGSGGGSLASAGGGMRMWIGRMEAGLELGIPLSRGFDGTDQDPRLSFSLGARF